jgi:ABC-type Fe3+ transport system permease subunit
MARSEKLPVARPYEDTWPKELAHLRVGLMGRATFLVVALWIVVGAITVVLMLELWARVGTPARDQLRHWIGPYATSIAFGLSAGLLSCLLYSACDYSIRKVRTRRYRNVLLAHGFCPCGYKYVEQGESRSCPECGRQWTVKQPPRE